MYCHQRLRHTHVVPWLRNDSPILQFEALTRFPAGANGHRIFCPPDVSTPDRKGRPGRRSPAARHRDDTPDTNPFHYTIQSTNVANGGCLVWAPQLDASQLQYITVHSCLLNTFFDKQNINFGSFRLCAFFNPNCIRFERTQPNTITVEKGTQSKASEIYIFLL